MRRMQLFADLYDALTGFPKPTIAACHGDVVGGGAEIAVACDMRVGGSNLRMRFPGAALGVPVGPARLVTLCGLATAKYLLLSSRTVGADEALRLGPGQPGRPGGGDRGGGARARRRGRRPPARGGRPAEADAARVGRRRGALGATRAAGQVEWQRSGPRPAVPRLTGSAILESDVSAATRRIRVVLRAMCTASADRDRARDERFAALAARVRAAAAGERRCARRLGRAAAATCSPRCSKTSDGLAGRPALLSSPPTTARRATSRADLAPTWRRGASATTPRAGPATRRTSRRRRTWSGCGSPRSTRWSRTRRAPAGRRRQRDRARRGGARRLACAPTASLLTRRELDLGDVATLLAEAGYERVDQVEERGQFAVRGGILDVFPAPDEVRGRCDVRRVAGAARGVVADPARGQVLPAGRPPGRGPRDRRR